MTCLDGDLKAQLAVHHPGDIEAHSHGKDGFVKEHEAKALSWRASRARRSDP
jgi:hypothetical protein